MHTLAGKGFNQTHSTVRVPGDDHHFLFNPFGLRLGEVKASDLIKIDLDGKVIGPSKHPGNRAGYVIHSAIHMRREDARCVIHTHTLPGKGGGGHGRRITGPQYLRSRIS
ncbi:MAG: hypothetical protein Ct9H300mP16_03470 [Pseudomonadota bacterium]|nr:MAG: hypothetical protein Ct9H300mP16_03470 [Pseudomonadota bacterium]